MKEADERRGPEDYLHKWTIPEELGGFKRLIFGDAALAPYKITHTLYIFCFKQKILLPKNI